MAKQTINIVTLANDGTGTTIRDGGDLINDNFNEIYTALGDGSTLNIDSSGASNNDTLIFNSGTGKFEAGTAGAFTVAGDGGTNQTIGAGDTFNIQGGTGITTTGVNTDVITISIDGTVATASSTTTFTNKTFDADGTGNSITNIENDNIKSGAAIDASKIHDGSVSNTEFGHLNGVNSNIQDQINASRLAFAIALG